MNQCILMDAAAFEEWTAARRRWDMDFEPEVRLPCFVVWAEVEANGYQDVVYADFTQADLSQLAASLEVS